MGTPSRENQAQLDGRVEDEWRDATNRLKYYTYKHYYWLPMKVRGADLDNLVSEAIVDTLTRGRVDALTSRSRASCRRNLSSRRHGRSFSLTRPFHRTQPLTIMSPPGAVHRAASDAPSDFNGFYEWKRETGSKQPFFFRMLDERPFGFAGLWDGWEGDRGQVINSCTILTTDANEVLRPVHDRMPVVLHPDDYELWLDKDVRKRDLLQDLLRPYPASEMIAYPVSTLINSSRNQGAELVKLLAVNST